MTTAMPPASTPSSIGYQPVRRGKGGGGGRKLIVWAVGTVVIGGMLVAVLLPSLCRSSETANRVKCASNLRQLGQAITLYTQAHGGTYPPSLAAVFIDADMAPEVLTCPSSNDEKAEAPTPAGVVALIAAAENNAPGHQPCLSYVYTGQTLTARTATPDSIVAYEHLDDHDRDGTNVLFGDGRVEWIDRKAWLPLATAAGFKVAPPPGQRP